MNITGLLNIAHIDSSAGMRIVPSLQLIEYFSAADFKFILFGKGAAQSTFFYSAIWGQLTLVGFIPAFVYNYGIVGTLVALFCLSYLFPKEEPVLLLMFFLFLFNADFNTQIFVYVVFVAMLSKRIKKLVAPQTVNSKTQVR